jgi:predicted porin
MSPSRSLYLAIITGLTALHGVANAQTTVSPLPGAEMTLYGRLDLSVGQEYDTGNKFMANGSGSRMGLRGSYDLNEAIAGAKAVFNIEHRFKGDTGAADSSSSFWNGRSVVGLSTAWGEVLLGREYSAAYSLSQALSDPWGFDTVAGSGTEYAMLQNKLAKKRYDNSVSYNVKAAGFVLGVQTSEQEGGLVKRPVNLGIGYQEGPIKVGLGYEKTGESSNSKLISVAGSYKLDAVRLMAGFGKGEDKAAKDYRSLQVGAGWTIGQGEVRASVTQLDNTTSDIKLSQQIALGYHHNLHKSVTLYTDIARDNKRFTGSKEDLTADVGLKLNF